MKYQFIKFYIDKKFYTPLPASGVEPFVKGDENLFEAESRLPYYFPLGFSLTLLYTFAMLMSLYKSRLHEPVSEIKNPIGDLKKDDNSIFILCQNSRIKDEIFNYYRQQPDAACLEKINAADFQLELGSADIFKHFCKINGADEVKATQNLSLLHINDLKKENSTHEIILQIYAAIKMSGNHKYIVLDDFFKNQSRQFEDNFIELLTSQVASGKRIIYLGSEMFFSRRGLEINETLNNKNFSIISFSLGKVALR